jgi:hypothetical protein
VTPVSLHPGGGVTVHTDVPFHKSQKKHFVSKELEDSGYGHGFFYLL